MEWFNRTVRYDWLNQHLFESIEHAQETATQWLSRYDAKRTNMGAGLLSPRIRNLQRMHYLCFWTSLLIINGGLTRVI